MKKLFVLISATLPGNALHDRLLKATDEQTHCRDIKGMAKRLYDNPHAGGSLPVLAKPAADQFLTEVHTPALVVHT